ncbi:hypothetical protein BCR32DRAFT_270943 [Anaeromyces robustus]|uniref:P-type domain-containing protein n=1 Tax=Anaeromyces robustus TaxID=1754192 RepID=A0A1Y1WUB9_9FUNG|nr:hypothetical protein BCR32DRAFT_270943 [Anaeromyces robustus]|eukprot:ORX76995.1 hypothetical protein BCR32DRAFT_270943 [Anaeromyces robustus]
MKINNLLLISQLIALSSAGLIRRDNSDKCSCSVNPHNRKDCGYYGITESECVKKGCCWGSTDVNGAPWCFYTASGGKTTDCNNNGNEGKSCEVDIYKREDCGYYGINKSGCESRGCCWAESNVSGIPCRKDCGYLGITKNECEAGGCCWAESETEGIPWCFNQPGKNIKIEKEAITIRFLKPEGWSHVNLWAWDAEENNLYGEVWPGKPIKDLGNGWYSHTFPKDIGYVNVLFNNGVDQTKDIRGIKSSTCLKLFNDNILNTVDCGLDLAMCKISGKERVQCGSDGITAEQCADLNCCYNELAGAPSCFYGSGQPKNTAAGSCNIINPLQRTQCGEANINEKECNRKGCCYNELNGAPSCFNHGPNVPSCIVDVEDREQCGQNGISQNSCESQGCCYDPNAKQCFKKGAKPSIGGGDCVYTVTDLETSETGMKAILDLEGRICQKYDVDFQTLDFEAKFETDTRLHIHVQPTDIKNNPHNVDMPAAAYPFEIENEPLNDLQYSYELTNGQNFQLQVKRNDGSVVFDGMSFIFERQYLELSKKIRSDASIYGFGEVLAPYKRNSQDTQHALFNADNATPIGQNLYGSHPFYIEIIDVIGGNFDMYFFMGPTMDDVVKQYYKVIGAPALLPYWSLGWHQCRYGYEDIWAVENVVANYKKHNIPLDTMWIDIDFMDAYKDFTYNPNKFPVSEVRKFVSDLKRIINIMLI